MNAVETFRIALNSLLINRLRSALTTLGIIIGVGAVITLISLGRGAEVYIQSQFEDLGATLLEVNTAAPENENRTRIQALTSLEAEDLANPLIAPSVRRVGTSYRFFGTVVSGRERTQLNVSGVSANYADILKWDVRYGTFITEAQVASDARVAVLGLDVVENLFADRNFNPVGLTVRINDRVFAIIGVMEERGGAFFSENNVVFVPVTTAQTRMANARARDGGFVVNTIHVDVRSEELLDQARAEIFAYLDVAHGITFADERDYRISSDAGLLEIIDRVTGVLTIFLGMIAGISLLVGGIGIMNIMLVSVTERTKEIGLRKAVGAQYRDILLQFLLESVVLSLLGGVIGILVGYVAAIIGTNLYAELTMTVQLDSVILATGVSTFVGIFFGYYPANRAARMKPIDALRYE